MSWVCNILIYSSQANCKKDSQDEFGFVPSPLLNETPSPQNQIPSPKFTNPPSPPLSPTPHTVATPTRTRHDRLAKRPLPDHVFHAERGIGLPF